MTWVNGQTLEFRSNSTRKNSITISKNVRLQKAHAHDKNYIIKLVSRKNNMQITTLFQLTRKRRINSIFLHEKKSLKITLTSVKGTDKPRA